MNIVFWILMGLGCLILVLLVSIFAVKQMALKRLTELRSRYPEHEVMLVAPTVSLIGRESPSEPMLRGNGSLLLTRKDLVLQLWVPKQEIIISRKDILGVGEAEAFAGKRIAQKLLAIAYRNPKGETETLALYLPEQERWKHTLQWQRAD